MPKWWSKKSSLRWRWLLPVSFAIAVFHFSPLGATLDRAFFDFASRHPARASTPPGGSAIVLIDEPTMAALSAEGLGTWPPPRAAFAALIAGLSRAGAAKVVLDFIFIDQSSSAEQDLLLGHLAAGLPEVVLARTVRQAPVFWDDEFVAAHASLFTGYKTGIVEGAPDSDGVLRRYNLPRSLAAAGFENPPTAPGGLLRWHGGLARLSATDSTVPVLSATRFILGGLPVVYRLSETHLDSTPAELARVVQAEVPLTGPGFDDVRGRIVFVGANTEGSFDQKPFAIGGLEPGVLFHWTAWANHAGGGFIREVPPWSAPLLALGFVALLAAIGIRPSGIVMPVALAAGLAITVAGLAYVGHSSGWFFPPATPVAAAGFALLGVVAENFWLERQRRHEVQAMFGSYVAPEIVELLVRDPTAIRVGGERREATVFFCDLAGFTDLSEQVSPEELLGLINGYLEQTSECLMTHGGYVDKYIGDAVMAVFGVPKAIPDHALAAGRAALAVQRLLAERNVQLAATYGRTLGLRIGLNTGAMIVGNVGSERKKNYTVLGDAVNLASRLEGANKEFGTRILVGEATARAIGDRLVLRPLTGLRVKGKHTAVPVFELVGAPDEITPAQKDFLEAYAAAHALYTRRQFAEAVPALTRAAALSPTDAMTGKLLAESRHFALHSPPSDWLPIISLDTK